MAGPVYALTAALIWAVSPIYYRVFLGKFDFLSFNLLRTSTAATVLILPALYLWGFSGLGFAALSGMTTLACGDSLYLLAIRETGASVASPVVNSYVLIVQLAGVALGQAVPYANLASALMVVAGIYVLSRGGGGKARLRGISFALGAAVIWTVGQELIQASTDAGGNFVVVAFVRNGAAALALGAAFLATKRYRSWPSGLTARDCGFILTLMVSDLVVGSLLFVYSVSTVGVALTVLLTSLSPLLTQVFAKALGKEAPTLLDYAGGALIVSALVLAVAF
ncbi:MAG: DMT family transporter [Nitrososphaerota archaeon]|nr:DMT family transporter [Nitrososphaerota archaeon]